MVRELKRASSSDPAIDLRVRRAVAEILERIDREGVDAVRDYSRRFDDWDPADFRVAEEDLAAAEASVPEELRRHIDFALDQIRGFAAAQRSGLTDLRVETLPGVILGHRMVPVQRVGAYVPGGLYPLIASAFMTVAVAKVAGVEKVTAVAPPASGEGINPASLYAMTRSGADEVYCLGGVQAIAALALGLGGITASDMVVGPGNAYVAEAKRQLFGRVGIDLVAGPSEILIIADETATPSTLALDLLAQAEHGPTSRAILVTWSEQLARATMAEVDAALGGLPVDAPAAESWRRRGEILLTSDWQEALERANLMAIEHVHVQAAAAHLERFREKLNSFGSLFLGETTTVVFGDKAIGTNHCLPTERGARFSGGLWVGTFLRVQSYQEVSLEGAKAIAPAAAAIAAAEGMDAHARSAAQRANGRPTVAAGSAELG